MGGQEPNGRFRTALSNDLEKLSQHYTDRARRIYTRIDEGIDRTAVLLTALAALRRHAGDRRRDDDLRATWPSRSPTSRASPRRSPPARLRVSIPFSERSDEIGALARSIAVFQRAMRHNEELNRTVRDDAETRTQRQEQMSGEISRFSAEVEATLAELGRISDQMLAASTQLAGAADDASAKTERRDRPPRRRPPPMCATSRPPPTNCRPP